MAILGSTDQQAAKQDEVPDMTEVVPEAVLAMIVEMVHGKRAWRVRGVEQLRLVNKVFKRSVEEQAMLTGRVVFVTSMAQLAVLSAGLPGDHPRYVREVILGQNLTLTPEDVSAIAWRFPGLIQLDVRANVRVPILFLPKTIKTLAVKKNSLAELQSAAAGGRQIVSYSNGRSSRGTGTVVDTLRALKQMFAGAMPVGLETKSQQQSPPKRELELFISTVDEFIVPDALPTGLTSISITFLDMADDDDAIAMLDAITRCKQLKEITFKSGAPPVVVLVALAQLPLLERAEIHGLEGSLLTAKPQDYVPDLPADRQLQGLDAVLASCPSTAVGLAQPAPRGLKRLVIRGLETPDASIVECLLRNNPRLEKIVASMVPGSADRDVFACVRMLLPRMTALRSLRLGMAVGALALPPSLRTLGLEHVSSAHDGPDRLDVTGLCNSNIGRLSKLVLGVAQGARTEVVGIDKLLRRGTGLYRLVLSGGWALDQIPVEAIAALNADGSGYLREVFLCGSAVPHETVSAIVNACHTIRCYITMSI